jgi:hypothetical protein
MTSAIRKTMWVRAALTIGLVTVVGSGAIAAASVAPHATPTTAHGGGFLIRSGVNQNYCVDVVAGATQGRALSLSACSQNASQRWTFTENADGTNVIVDSLGMCVDAAGRKAGDGVALRVVRCSFVKAQRASYSSVGRIQVSGTKNCFSVPQAHAGAPVFLATCSSAAPLEQFRLSL